MTVVLKNTRTTSHHVAIEIHRVNRVRDCNFGVSREEFLDICNIALGTIAHEHVVRIHFNAARSVFATDNGFAKEIITLFWTVTAERPLDPHFVHSLVHGFDYSGDNRRSHIANAQADDVCISVGALVFLDFLGNC